MSEEYNGWANRETWAFVLHCDNTIGAEFIVESLVIDDDDSDHYIGEVVVDMVQELMHESEDGDSVAEWVQMLRDDVGSFWRIDYREVGRWAREYADEMVGYES
jgi:hypothetical protein